MSVLLSHLSQMRARFVAEHGKDPEYIALGRWDVRELVKAAAPYCRPATTALELLRAASEGDAYLFGLPVKVDFRIGRMPGGLWFPVPRRLH